MDLGHFVNICSQELNQSLAVGAAKSVSIPRMKTVAIINMGFSHL